MNNPLNYEIKISLVFGAILIFIFCACKTKKNNLSSETSLRNAAIKWQNAIDSKDIEITVASFAIEAVGMYHSNLPIYGRDGNRKAWESVYSDPANQHPITVEQVNVSRSGDMGYTIGKWWSIRPKINYSNGGRYVAVWKLIGGQWQIVMISANVHEDVKAERQPE
jgi:ketosteroid isomerase-like protein